MLTDDQVQDMLGEYLCAARRDADPAGWARAIETVGAVCRHRADGHTLAFLFGVASHGIMLSSGGCSASEAFEACRSDRERSGTDNQAEKLFSLWGAWLEQTLQRIEEPAAAENHGIHGL